VPKKPPAAVNTQIVMVTAVSLVVIMFRLPLERNGTLLTVSRNPIDNIDAGQTETYGVSD
jgi:hypothetical protein